MNDLPLFGGEPMPANGGGPVKTDKPESPNFSAYEFKAIRLYKDAHGYGLALSVYPNVHFVNHSTNEPVVVAIKDVVDEYKKLKKEEQKERARERRAEKKWQEQQLRSGKPVDSVENFKEQALI